MKRWLLVLLVVACGMQAKKITVIGTGYVGLIQGACLADFGHDVICADIDAGKIEKLKLGQSPIFEPGLEDLMKRATASGRLTFTTDIAGSIRASQVVFIAVGTPMADDGSANLKAVEAVAGTIRDNLVQYTAVVIKSTVPVGTGAWVHSIIAQKPENEVLFDMVSNPEFLREGSAIKDFMEPDRIVVGSQSSKALGFMRDVYKPLLDNDVPCVETSRETAETIKYIANAFLALKVSFINQVARYCDAVGADVHDVATGIGLDRRISPHFLKPGPGFGGSCFPKDSTALVYSAKQYGIDMSLVEASLTVNDSQRQYVMNKITKLVGDLNGKVVAVLGLAFKANTDDVRYSPALDVINLIRAGGGIVRAYDPEATQTALREISDLDCYATAYEAAKGADAVVIMTEWDEFRTLDLKTMGELMAHKNIIDTRNLFDPAELVRHEFAFENIGRSSLRK